LDQQRRTQEQQRQQQIQQQHVQRLETQLQQQQIQQQQNQQQQQRIAASQAAAAAANAAAQAQAAASQQTQQTKQTEQTQQIQQIVNTQQEIQNTLQGFQQNLNQQFVAPTVTHTVQSQPCAGGGAGWLPAPCGRFRSLNIGLTDGPKIDEPSPKGIESAGYFPQELDVDIELLNQMNYY